MDISESIDEKYVQNSKEAVKMLVSKVIKSSPVLFSSMEEDGIDNSGENDVAVRGRRHLI